MNAQVQESQVAVIPPKPPTVIERAMAVFVAVPSEESLRELAKGSATITTITNQAGYDQCHTARMVLKNARLEIVRTGEDGREDAVQTSKAILARQKALIAITQGEEDRLAVIQKAWDDRIAAEKEAAIQREIARTAAIQAGIDRIRNWPVLAAGKSTDIIQPMLTSAQGFEIDPAIFEERCEEAVSALAVSIAALIGLLAVAKAHEEAQEQLKRDQAELAERRAADAERDRLAKIESDRLAKEVSDQRAAEAREQRERLAKEEADAKAARDAAAKADEENSRRNEMALQEVQAIHHQLMIADTGRRPYCNGGDLASIDFAIDGTEKWELTEERLGALFAMAVKTKEATLVALAQKKVDFIARLANAAEAKRQAELAAKITADREQLERDQEAARKAAEPKPEPAKVRTVERPSAAQIVACVASHYSVSPAMATKWLVATKIELEAAA